MKLLKKKEVDATLEKQNNERIAETHKIETKLRTVEVGIETARDKAKEEIASLKEGVKEETHLTQERKNQLKSEITTLEQKRDNVLVPVMKEKKLVQEIKKDAQELLQESYRKNEVNQLWQDELKDVRTLLNEIDKTQGVREENISFEETRLKGKDNNLEVTRKQLEKSVGEHKEQVDKFTKTRNEKENRFTVLEEQYKWVAKEQEITAKAQEKEKKHLESQQRSLQSAFQEAREKGII